MYLSIFNSFRVIRCLSHPHNTGTSNRRKLDVVIGLNGVCVGKWSWRRTIRRHIYVSQRASVPTRLGLRWSRDVWSEVKFEIAAPFCCLERLFWWMIFFKFMASIVLHSLSKCIEVIAHYSEGLLLHTVRNQQDGFAPADVPKPSTLTAVVQGQATTWNWQLAQVFVIGVSWYFMIILQLWHTMSIPDSRVLLNTSLTSWTVDLV